MDSHPFMSIHPLIPMIELFRNLTFKIQGQSHRSRSHNRYTILSPHIPFIPCWSALPFLRCSYLKNWPSKSKVKPSRSWVTSKFKVTMWVQHPIDSHPFRSMSIWHPIAELRLFQNLTLKSTHIPFVPCQSGIPFVSYDFFKNLTLKIKGQGHGWGHSSKSQCGSSILSNHILFVPCQSALPFFRYSIFKIWPWKSRVKIIGEVTVQSHNVGLASYRLTSLSFQCQLALPFLRYSIFKIWPWKSRVKAMGEVTVQSHNVGLHPIDSHPFFAPCQLTFPFLRYSISKIWP